MRDLDALPAWVARQRNRFRGRRSDEKIVRWINYRPLARDPSAALSSGGADTAGSSGKDNVMPFTSGRSDQLH